ncbi:MarR family winged helix-turn-helix transcriptional regulator [Spelaeicoccus albus]|uniref:DNA-binding MarR family transcriptional regulator n=1 Tax=Spelaeicoccus albus TaxID=1280376 RepID=A0A7Z0D471_9MICO|nr:MarR family transcriptional regulator [Spelaeicoccus albus]NYI68491.1 DNA-binding MarR family transcriptional regulator [Spelaeicoccus albus]
MRTNDTARRADGELIDALAQSAFLTMGVLTRLAADNDLSLTQLRVLAILRDRDLQMGDLASYLGLEKSTLTGLVSRAEKRGLVQRRASGTDRRGVDVRLSDQGQALAARLTGDLESLLAPLTDALDPAERDDLRRLLAKATGAAAPSR